MGKTRLLAVSCNGNPVLTPAKVRTIIATTFVPLTFIVGVYGMNFDYMPELRWHWGYHAVWAVMLAVGVGMLLWFRRKGWFQPQASTPNKSRL